MHSCTHSLTPRSCTMRVRVIILGAAILLAACTNHDPGSSDSASSDITTTQRPPQFVLLAFDGSLNNAFCDESRAFAKDAKVKFTYFISGTYFIPNAQKRQYVGPHGHGPGSSEIGFGGDLGSIALRFKNVQAAADDGHEIG